MTSPPDTWTEAEKTEYGQWLEERPRGVREIAEQFPPWQLYRLKSSGHTVLLHSYDEPKDESQPITLKVDVLREHNPAIRFERRVFGIPPEDLEPILEDVG